MNQLRLLSTGALALVCASASFASLINGSFEDGAFVSGQNPESAANAMQVMAGSNAITGWSLTADAGNDVHWNQNGAYWGWVTPFGERFIDLSGWSDTVNNVILWQDFGALAGQQYQVDYDIAVDSNWTINHVIHVKVGLGNSYQNTSLTLPNQATGTYWEHRSMLFTASGNNDVVSFQGIDNRYCIGLDNVSVRAVPEPATLTCALLGLVPFFRRRKSQR